MSGSFKNLNRISARLNWTEKECKTPEATRKELESWLPVDRYRQTKSKNLN